MWEDTVHSCSTESAGFPARACEVWREGGCGPEALRASGPARREAGAAPAGPRRPVQDSVTP